MRRSASILVPFLLTASQLALPSQAPAQVLNEIRVDEEDFQNPNEYIEIAGTPGTDLTGFAIIVIGDDANNSSGVIEEVINLDGQTISSSGYFVIAEATLSLGTADISLSLNFEEDDNVTFLLVEGFTGANGDDLDTNDDGMLDITPWTRIVETIALIERENPPNNTEYHYGPPAVGPDNGFTPAHVYRCPDGSPTGVFEIGAYDLAMGVDTPGSENTSCAQQPPDAGVPDAGTGPDASPDAPDASPNDPDAGNGVDGGMDMPDAGPGPGPGLDAGNGGGQPSSGGCCNVNRQANPGTLLLALFVGGLLLYRRRQRQ